MSEVTLDTFGFLVPRLVGCFSLASLKKIVTIILGHPKDNLFAFNALQGGPPGSFWAQNWPKNMIFYSLPI